MIHLAAAPRGEEKGGGGGMAAMAGWQGAQEEAKQSPSVGPSLGGGAVAGEVVRCGGGGARDVRVRHEERDNSESLSGCANRHGSRGGEGTD